MIYQVLINGIITGSIYFLIAIGFTIIFRAVKFYHFAHGAVLTIVAYLTYSFMISFHLPIYFVISLSIIITIILGILIYRYIYLPLINKRSNNLVLLLASLGIFIFIQNLIQLIYGSRILSIRKDSIGKSHEIFGIYLTSSQIGIIIISILIFIIVSLYLKKTKYGKAIRAVSDDRIASAVVGINPDKIITRTFALGSFLAAIAGIVIAYETNIEPTMGFNAILKGVIAAIIGGIGSVPGAFLGGLLLGLSENIGIWSINAGWKDLISFAILIIFLLFRPNGIMGIKNKNEQI